MFELNVAASNKENTVLCLCVLLLADDTATYFLATWLIVGVLLHLFTVVILLCCLHRKKIKNCNCKYLFVPFRGQMSKCFQLILYAIAVAFAVTAIIDTTSGNCSSAQQHLGIFTVALTWINLIRLLSKFPIVGQHAIIFGRIIWTFLKLAVFALLVLFAATIILTTILFDSQALVRKLPGFYPEFWS